jgi:16S rRNA C967 or C1407 C5-methylase (RsmB/RsmF family)
MTYNKPNSTGNKSKGSSSKKHSFNSNSSSKSPKSKSNYNSKNSSESNKNKNSNDNRSIDKSKDWNNKKFSNESNSNRTNYNKSVPSSNESSKYGDRPKFNENSNSENRERTGNRFNDRKKAKPTAEENKAFAIKGNYKPSDRPKRDYSSYASSQSSTNSNGLPPQRSKFSGSVRPGSKDNNSGRQILLDRYDKNFGPGTSTKLQNAIQAYSENQFIRVNFSKMTLDEVQIFFKKNRVKFEDTFLKNAFKIERSFFNLSSSLPFLTGQIYFQDLASQVPVNCVDFERLKALGRKVKVLDGCASPGSKTTQMLDLLNFHKIEYELIAIEIDESRINRLINNIQKMGFSGFKIVNVSASEFTTSDKFDVMILDVPCSGNLVGDKNWLSKRNVSDICEKADLQKSIVNNLSKYLANDGELIYSTCSIEAEEDELNVKWIKDNCELKNVKINLETGFDTTCLYGVDGLRFLPHKSRTQGFFVAKFVNK